MLSNANPLREEVELHYLLGTDLPPLGHRIRIGHATGTVHQLLEQAEGPTIVRVWMDDRPAAMDK